MLKKFLIRKVYQIAIFDIFEKLKRFYKAYIDKNSKKTSIIKNPKSKIR